MSQASLLELLGPPAGGTLGLAGLMPSIRAEMFRVAEAYEPGRKMLADAVSKVAQREAVPITSSGAKSVSTDLLDKWLQPGAAGHAPNVHAIMCFCAAVGDFSPLLPLLKPAGLTVIPKDELKYLKYGRNRDAARKIEKEKRQLEAEL